MKFKQYPLSARFFRHLYSIPFIYSMIIPIVILDVFLELFHRCAFPLYGLDYIRRSRYVVIDRHKLSYLRFVEKIHCMYCGYVNGLLAYAVAIAGETERYWCGIQHQKNKGVVQSPHSKKFLGYNDEKSFRNYVKKQAE